jgi:hypothetical protein
VRLLTDRTIPVMGHSLSWEAGLLFDPGSSLRGWLIYGYSDRWGHTQFGTGVPHAMVGRRIEFEQASVEGGR